MSARVNGVRAVTRRTHRDSGVVGVAPPSRWPERDAPMDPSGAAVKRRHQAVGSLQRPSLRADFPSNLNGAGYSGRVPLLPALAKWPCCAATVGLTHQGLRRDPRRRAPSSHDASTQRNQRSSAGGIMAVALVKSPYMRNVKLNGAEFNRGWSV
jgi:hypothetical protein